MTPFGCSIHYLLGGRLLSKVEPVDDGCQESKDQRHDPRFQGAEIGAEEGKALIVNSCCCQHTAILKHNFLYLD